MTCGECAYDPDHLYHRCEENVTDTQADLTRARDLAGKLWWMAQLPWDKAEPNMTAALQSEREAAAAEAEARIQKAYAVGKYAGAAEARRALEEIADMEGAEGMTDYRFAERALAIANAFLASPPAPQEETR